MALWTPYEINTLLWLDAADASTIITDVGVSQWNDKSGNERNYTQSTGSLQPAQELDGSIDTTGGKYLSHAPFIKDIALSSGLRMYAVFSADEETTTLLGEGNTSDEFPIHYHLGDITILRGDGDTYGRSYNRPAGMAATTSKEIFACSDKLPDAEMRKNGVVEYSTTYTTTTATVNTNTIGGLIRTTFENRNIKVSEIVLTPYDVDNTDIIEGYLAWKWGLEANLSIDHPYKLAAPTLDQFLSLTLEQGYDLSHDIVAAVLEQSYSVSEDVEVSCEQIYSMLLEIWGLQYYGDAPWLQKQLAQYYGSAAILQKSLMQRWGEALELTIDLEQNWSMPDLLQIISDQHYGITSEVLHKTSEQLYHINQLSTLFAASHQAYAIAGEIAAIYRFDTRLFVNGEQVPFTKLQWESSENDYFWSCEAVVASKEVAVKCADGAELRIDWAGESCFFKCYDGWMLDKRFGAESYRIKGFSKAKDLYYAGKLSGDIAGGMASQLVAGLASSCGITIDWQMDDGYIASGKLVANDESPLDVIRKIVWDCKGKLRPTLDGNLIAAYEEEVAVPDYPTTTPADTIIARMERISTSESRDEQQGYNKFTVSDQLPSAESRNLVKDMIDSRTAELREYATPLYPGLEFKLSHKGPVSVSIEPFGLIETEIKDELIVFENGSARTSLPIYAITDRAWQAESLGLVSFSEDGLLAAEVKEYGLLRLSYITKYFRWIAKHPSIADVLFTADEVSQ